MNVNVNGMKYLFGILISSVVSLLNRKNKNIKKITRLISGLLLIRFVLLNLKPVSMTSNNDTDDDADIIDFYDEDDL